MKTTKEKIETLIAEEIQGLIREKGLVKEQSTGSDLKSVVDFIGRSLTQSLWDSENQLGMVTLFQQAGKQDLANKAAQVRELISDLLPELSALKAMGE